jgi:hypothetical protein
MKRWKAGRERDRQIEGERRVVAGGAVVFELTAQQSKGNILTTWREK